jgi:hypothetical protein
MSIDKYSLQEMHGQLHGEVSTTTVTVSGGPTLLPAAPLKARKDVSLHNAGSVTVYLGGPDVTVNDGTPLAPGEDWQREIGRAQLYAVASGIDQLVRVLEIS